MYRFGDYPPRRRIPVHRVDEIEDTIAQTEKDDVPPVAIDEVGESVRPSEEDTDWRNTAMRLQADMANFRKRQTRLAEQSANQERERLLRGVLPVADNLARVLEHTPEDHQNVLQGVELTYRELMRFLESEGVTRMQVVGRSFDPDWHEAVATLPTGADAGTVIEEVEPGYIIDENLLRPARVVVAA